MTNASRRRFAMALATIAIVLPRPAEAANFAGTWVIHGTMGKPAVAEVNPVCVFTQDGNQLKGTCKGPNGVGPADGTVDGQNIVFHWAHVATSYNGMTATTTFKGTLGAVDAMAGTWTTPTVPDKTGTFTAQKVK